MKKLIACLVSIALCLSKKQAETPHLNIEYRWGMNAVNASDREIWSKKQYNTYRKLLFLNLQKGG